MVICLGQGADFHTAQLMLLPFSHASVKFRLVLVLVLPFWYLLTRVVPDIFQKSSKTAVCVCVFWYSLTWVIPDKTSPGGRKMDVCVRE